MDWRLAMGPAGPAALRMVGGNGRGRLLVGPTEQIFSEEAVNRFLGRLRRWARRAAVAEHASTPGLLVLRHGDWRAMALEDTPARWHYLFAIATSGNGALVRVGLAAGNGPGARIADVRSVPDRLLLLPASASWGFPVAAGPRPGSALCAALWSGYLW